MKLIPIWLAVGASVMLTIVVFAEPMDRIAYENLQTLKNALSRSDHQLTQTEENSVMKAGESDSAQVRMVAAYMLTFTDSQAGTNALRTLAASDNPDIAGAAEFATLRKQLVRLKDQELLQEMEAGFEKLKYPMARTLMASWLGDKLKVSVVPLFMTALEKEENRLTRAELFLQVASHGNRDQLEKASSMLKQKQGNPDGAFNEGISPFLDGISQNPQKRTNLPSFLERVIESKLKEKE
jgi:hypothetical protein